MDIFNFTITLLTVAAVLATTLSLIIAIRGHILAHSSNAAPNQNESGFVGCLVSSGIILFALFSILYGLYFFNPQTIYLRSTSISPALDDTLSNQDSYGWTVGNDCTYSNEGLHAVENESDYSLVCIAEATNFRNFVYQAQMLINSGTGGGIAFRADTYRNFYEFDLQSDGYYSLDLYKNGQFLNSLKNGNIHIDSSQFNLLTVIAHDNSFNLYINRQFISSASDSTFSFGEIGVSAMSNSDVVFTNAQVWNL